MTFTVNAQRQSSDSGTAATDNPPCGGPSQRVCFLSFENRGGAGSSTDRHYACSTRISLAPPTPNQAFAVLRKVKPAEVRKLEAAKRVKKRKGKGKKWVRP